MTFPSLLRSAFADFLTAFFAVAREGLETALFVYTNFKTVAATSSASIGLVLGLALAVVLGSLYPIVTALLAFKILHERLHKIQYVGIGFAIAGVAVISLS